MSGLQANGRLAHLPRCRFSRRRAGPGLPLVLRYGLTVNACPPKAWSWLVTLCARVASVVFVLPCVYMESFGVIHTWYVHRKHPAP